MIAARTPKAMCWGRFADADAARRCAIGTAGERSQRGSGAAKWAEELIRVGTVLLLALDLRALLVLAGRRHRGLPLAESLLVVQELVDAEVGVLVLRAPVQGVERAHLDADAAVHAQREVDVEAVQV